MKNTITDYGRKLLEAAHSYPLVLLMAIIAAATNTYLVESNLQEDVHFNLVKITITACLGISLFFALKILSQRHQWHFTVQLIGFIPLLGFYILLPDAEKDFNVVYFYKIAPIFLISHLLVAISSLSLQQKEGNFWQYNKNLFVNAFQTFVFTIILIGGILLAILAVDKLFNLDIANNWYIKTASFLVIFGSCSIFLLFCDQGLPTLSKESEYPKILKFFTQFVLIPLLITYLIILYLYTLKIIINWELPFGWVSYLILAYSVLGILALLLVHPLKAEDSKSWVKIFSKLFFYTLIPLAVLLFVAISVRLSAYGFTEPRYFVLALAIWISSLIIYFILSKKDKIQFIPISLMLVGVFSLSMPYFNAFSVSKRSQKNELEKLLQQEQLLGNGTIQFSKSIKHSTAQEIADKMTFLLMRKETEWVKKFITPKDFAKITKEDHLKSQYTLRYNIENLFTNTTENIITASTNIREIISDNSFKNVSDYQYMAKASDFGGKGLKINGETITLLNNNYSNRDQLELKLQNGEQLNFEPYIDQLFQKYPKASTTLPEVAIEQDLGKYHIKVIFDRITLINDTKDQRNYIWGDPIFLIKLK